MVYSIDIGNSFSVLYDGTKLHPLRSVIASVSSLRNLRRRTGVLKYQDSIYHCGDAAFLYDIHRVMAVIDKQSSTALQDSLVLILNVISLATRQVEEVTELVIQVPDTFTSYQHDLVSTVNGLKIWEYDDVEYRTRFNVKGVYQEGYGSWYQAQRSGAVDYEGFSIVIDLGGGTAITTLIENETGEVVKTFTHKHTGMMYLANLLMQDYDLQLLNDGNVLTARQIFEAFENGSYRIGLNGADFKDFLPQYTRQWWSHIWNTVVSTYRKQLLDRVITKIVVTGGGAEVVRPFINAARTKAGFETLFMISYNPLHDNVIGIYNAYHKN